MMLIGFIRIARPMHFAAGVCAGVLKLLQIVIQMPQRVRFDRCSRFAQLLPVGHFVHHPRALRAGSHPSHARTL